MRTMADDVKELGRQLLQLRRNGWPRDVNKLRFDPEEIEFPQPITSRPVECPTLTEVAQVCARCGVSIYRLIPPEYFRRDMTLERVICNDCAAGDHVEPLERWSW